MTTSRAYTEALTGPAATSAGGTYTKVGAAFGYDSLNNPASPPSAVRVPQPVSSTRYYRVTAVDDRDRESTPTSPVAVTTIAAAATPTGVMGTATSYSSARLSWHANPQPALAYVVQMMRYGYYQVDRGGSSYTDHGYYFETVCRTTSTSCDIRNLGSSWTERFYVAAENAHGRLSEPAVVDVRMSP